MSEDKKADEQKPKLLLVNFMVNKMEQKQFKRFDEFCGSRGASYGQTIPFLLEAYETLHKTGRITETPVESKEEKQGRFG